MQSTSPAPEVIIVGAGLGGLAAAIAIRLTGLYTVRVLEAAPVLGEIGAGIQISPNASRLLKLWGCASLLYDTVVAPQESCVRRWQNGEILMQRPTNPLIEQKYGSPYWHVHRADLHTALVRRAEDLGAVIRCGAQVGDVSVGNAGSRPSVTLLSGEKLDCDFLIGADGLNSKVREAGFPEAPKPQDTGDYAYRFTVPAEDIRSDSILSDLVKPARTTSWWGPGRHVVSYLLRAEKIFNVVAVFPDDGTLGNINKQVGDVKQMRKEFEGWCPQVRRLLEKANSNNLTKWRLMDLEPFEKWYRGRTVLLGDACHPMLPYLAQGSAQAMEDAAVLAECLRHFDSAPEIAAELYNDLRHSRATKIQQFSKAQRERNHLSDGLEQAQRDAAFVASSSGVKIAAPHAWKWEAGPDGEEKEWIPGLYEYDASKIARKIPFKSTI